MHGVNRAASFHADHELPQRIREVVMSVNVFWCNDGCIDGPARTPLIDKDLLLLLPFVDSLSVLDVQQTEITDIGLGTIAKLTALQSLNLSGTKITGGGLARLAALDKLRHLNLRECHLTPEDLSMLSGLPSLRTIELPSSAITDEVLAVLGQLRHLQSLMLAKGPFTDRGLSSLAPLEELTMLDLSETATTDSGLQHLVGLTQLKRLRLSQTAITGRGLSRLSRLRDLEELDLANTQVDDAGLEILAQMRSLKSLQLTGTKVRGFGLAHLGACLQLGDVALPPISVSAVAAVNAVKSWHRLSLNLVPDEDSATSDSHMSAKISDMPKLATLRVTSASPLKSVHVADCPALASLGVMQTASDPVGTAVHLDRLPALRDISLHGNVLGLTGDGLEQVTRMITQGSLTTDTVHAIARCRSLLSLSMDVAEVTGNPIPATGLSELPHVVSAQIHLHRVDDSWLLRLVGQMPMLEQFDLRGLGLDSSALAPLSNCPRMKHLLVRGVDDPGEPLAFLNSMPELDQFLVLGCPRIGQIRLTKDCGLRRFYFKYGLLNELLIDGAPNLTSVQLGHDAHGYNDEDARLNPLEIGRLTVRNAANLIYLMMDGKQSVLPLTEITVEETPHLRSLLLRAPERQSTNCRLTVAGQFPELVQRRLFHLRVDQFSLNHLNASPILRGGDVEDVEILADP